MFQDTSLDFKLVQRICLLQQALDQAMESMADLQHRVEEHQMLESHLAQTEEYSNVQQKIILNLQQQLSAKTRWQQQMLEKVLAHIEMLIYSQQLELERLRIRIQQSKAEVQTYLVRLKDYFQGDPPHLLASLSLESASEVMLARNLTVNLCSQMQTASQHIHELDRALTRYYVIFAHLKAQPHVLGNTLHQSLTAPESLPAPKADLTASSEQGLETWDEDSLKDPVALQAIVEAQYQKIAELGAELDQQFQLQTHIKQRCQLLAAERDHYKQQVDALRRENENLRSQLAQPQPRHQTIIPQWRSDSQEINPLFRFKPEQ